MKNKLRPLFTFYSLTFTWIVLSMVMLGVPAVAEAQPAEESTTAEVPDVTGMNQTDAQSQIMGGGFVVGTVTQAGSDTEPAGNIIGQNPASGTSVAPGTAINLIISAGPVTFTVPNVVGMLQKDAQTAITAAGLQVGNVSMTPSADISQGNVINQNPKGKTVVPQGTTVDIILSSGPP